VGVDQAVFIQGCTEHLGKYPCPYPQANNKHNKQKRHSMLLLSLFPGSIVKVIILLYLRGLFHGWEKCIKFHLAVIQS
jgi:hypothetical protein